MEVLTVHFPAPPLPYTHQEADGASDRFGLMHQLGYREHRQRDTEAGQQARGPSTPLPWGSLKQRHGRHPCKDHGQGSQEVKLGGTHLPNPTRFHWKERGART